MTAFHIGGQEVAPGTRRSIDLPVSVLSNHTPMTLSVHVVHGTRPGPTLFLTGAVHGDEIQGVEIIRRVLRQAALRHLCGTLLAVPIVNSFGFLNHSRYMPDRRDLNRSFPGSDHGSLASVLADLMMREVVHRSHYGIDLHTAALHRSNLPQIRVAPDEPELVELAEAFGPPVVLVSRLREGTLRQCARDKGIKVLLYEGGEALRFDELAIRAGTLGILRVMRHLGMVSGSDNRRARTAPAFAAASTWLRAPEGGILRSGKTLGEHVARGETIAEVTDPLGQTTAAVVSDDEGIIIGRTNLPIVNRGDALFHVARVENIETSRRRVRAIGSELAQPLLDEDEII